MDGEVEPEDGGRAAMEYVAAILEPEAESEDGSWTLVRNRKKTDEQLAQEFWEDIGYPTAASHAKLRRAGSTAETSAEAGGGTTLTSSSVVLSPSEPPAAVTKSKQCGVKIRPWRGPLPRPRVTPPVALAAFVPESGNGAAGSFGCACKSRGTCSQLR